MSFIPFVAGQLTLSNDEWLPTIKVSNLAQRNLSLMKKYIDVSQIWTMSFKERIFFLWVIGSDLKPKDYLAILTSNQIDLINLLN